MLMAQYHEIRYRRSRENMHEKYKSLKMNRTEWEKKIGNANLQKLKFIESFVIIHDDWLDLI